MASGRHAAEPGENWRIPTEGLTPGLARWFVDTLITSGAIGGVAVRLLGEVQRSEGSGDGPQSDITPVTPANRFDIARNTGELFFTAAARPRSQLWSMALDVEPEPGASSDSRIGSTILRVYPSADGTPPISHIDALVKLVLITSELGAPHA